MKNKYFLLAVPFLSVFATLVAKAEVLAASRLNSVGDYTLSKSINIAGNGTGTCLMTVSDRENQRLIHQMDTAEILSILKSASTDEERKYIIDLIRSRN